MIIKYGKLGKILIDKKINFMNLKNGAFSDLPVLVKMSKNEFVSLKRQYKIITTLYIISTHNGVF